MRPFDALKTVPLNALRAAEAVGRLGSLRGAAEELGVTAGAVSQQVARCEAVLGRTLFDRRPGGMAPAEGAQEILRLLSEGFGRISAGVELARRDRAHILTVSVAPVFAARWLIWRLGDFSRLHPEIKVRLESEVALVDPNAGDIDFAIRVGPGGYHGVTYEKLLDHRFIPICNRQWAERIESPADLAHVPIIRDMRAMFSWNDWLRPEGYDESLLGDGPEFSEASLCLDAAMSGAGVFLAFEALCWDALERGQIVAPIPRWHGVDMAYWLVSARDRSLSDPQRLFRRWLKGVLAESGLGG